MSGDVQARKRKEKRRKKADGEYTIRRISSVSADEEDSGTPPPPLVYAPESPSDNIIHIYKESHTGGHWCARIVFFILLAVLVSLVGIIIFEHRGTTDVDTPISSSRWAYVFDGWVDDTPPSHDGEEAHNEEDHGEVSEEEHEHDEEEIEDEGEDHEEEASHEEEEEEDDEHDEAKYDEEEEVEEEDDEDEGISEDDNEAEGVEDQSQEEEEEEEEEQHDSEANDEDIDEGIEQDDEEYEGNDDDGKDEEEDKDEQDEEDAGVLEELNVDSGENGQEDDDDNSLGEVEEDAEDASGELKDDEPSQMFMGIPGVNEIDDDGFEPLEEVESVEPEEIPEPQIEPEVEEEIEEESASVAVKFGVGVALVVAAHFVLVRRWNNAEVGLSELDGTPDLSRRNTILPPHDIKDVIKSASTTEEQVLTKKQAQSYEELRTQYSHLETDNPSKNTTATKAGSGVELERLKHMTPAKGSTVGSLKAETHQQKVVSSEEEEDGGEEIETSDGVSGVEEYEYEEDYSEGVEEEEEEVDEDEEGEEVDEEEEDIENIDDTELIAKLEAKYGKLPTPQDSEAEVDDEEYVEEEEEEELDDEDIAGWKRIKMRKPSDSGKPSQKPTQQAESGAKARDVNASIVGGANK